MPSTTTKYVQPRWPQQRGERAEWADMTQPRGIQLNPRDVVVPIFGLATNGRAGPFLGTGSIVGDGSILLTANHVATAFNGPQGILPMSDLARPPYPITLIDRDPAHDLALLRITEYRPPRPLVLEFEIFTDNTTLMTFEYGTTRQMGNTISLNPATRIGHMTRRLGPGDGLGSLTDDAIELSFPALRGASGAPVMINEPAAYTMLGKVSGGVVGVLIANASYHLAPAQIEEVLNADNTAYGETRYMLPQGLAVSVRHIQGIYEQAMAAGQ
jgi:hypothetical protein